MMQAPFQARALLALLASVLLAGCAFSALPVGQAPAFATSTSVPGPSTPSTLPVASATPSAPTPTPSPAASATPSVVLPTASATALPSAPPAPASPAPDPFLAAQAAALLPEQAGDLARAAAWDRYTISATLSPDQLTVRGSLAVEVTNRSAEPYASLYFHLYPNHPDFGGRLDVTGASVDGVPAASIISNGDTLLQLDLGQPVAPGGRVRAELSFVARTPRDASGRTFGAYNREAGVWSLANFYPVLARYFPGVGWDTRPIESRGDFTVTAVALYEVSVDAPVGWNLVSTGVPSGAAQVAAGRVRQRFVSGPQREFYLAALQGLDQASTTVDGTRVTVYYQPGSRQAGQRSLTIAEQSLRAFNARYGRYPLAELEVVQAALSQFLGMEYPGAVLIEQELYGNNGRGLETTVAHEIAHQWWYSQVGNDAQGEPWLDEGMASYAQIVYYEALGIPRAVEAELESFRDMYQRTREAGRDAPLASAPSALRGNYVPIVYAKGALFFQALRGQIGEAAFGRFLQDYYAAGRYREVSGADLLAAAQTACACDLTGFYRDWVLTTAPVAIP